MLPRAKSFPGLCLWLAASLAWPVSFPLATPALRPPEPTRLVVAKSLGPTIGGPARESLAPWAGCLAEADDPEEADGRDDLRFLPIPPTPGRFALDSLVPTTSEARPPSPFHASSPIPRSMRMRC